MAPPISAKHSYKQVPGFTRPLPRNEAIYRDTHEQRQYGDQFGRAESCGAAVLAEEVQPTVVGVHVAAMLAAGRAAFQVHDHAVREKENLPSGVVHTLAV